MAGRDDHDVLVIDPAHDAGAIVEGIAGRHVPVIVCTHGHNDHINAAVDLSERVSAPAWLHPDDRMLWDQVHPGRPPDGDLVRTGHGEDTTIAAETPHLSRADRSRHLTRSASTRRPRPHRSQE